MLDLPRIRRIKLHAVPNVQRFVGTTLLMPNYRLLPGLKVDFENTEHLPNEPVIFAMNHTDRYNYFPFQYLLWKRYSRFTATWVKGKYYENSFVGMFMELTNNIPTVSRGYLITKDFLSTMKRRPTDEEYEALRTLVDATAHGAAIAQPTCIPAELFERERNLLGHSFDPTRETYAEALDSVFRAMMARFVELHEDAFAKGLDVLVFPEGTRSIRLSRGRPGLAQIALRYRKTIVPVGCNGSDLAYPGSVPFARRGRVVYRFGEPIPHASIPEFHVDEDFQPFTVEAERDYGEKFQGLVDLVMSRINGLLDARHQSAGDLESEGVKGSARFV